MAKKQGGSKKSKQNAEIKMPTGAQAAAHPLRSKAAETLLKPSPAAEAAKLGAGAKTQAAPDRPSQFAGKTVATVFGEMVWLLSQSPEHRDLRLSDLEGLLMPPILYRQFKLYYAGQTPVAFEVFANVSADVAARIDAGNKKLEAKEWRSGEIRRLIERVELKLKSQASTEAKCAN